MALGVGLVLVLVLAGCPPKPGLVGNWRVVYTDDFVEYWTFFANGSFEWASADGDSYGEGTYTREGNVVTATESWDDEDGTHEVLTVITLAEDELGFEGTLTESVDGVDGDPLDFVGTKR
jgi:hypothetical protein